MAREDAATKTAASLQRGRKEPSVLWPKNIPRTGMERGIVKWFDSRMGYGFVVDPGGRDVFLHRRVLRRAGRRKLDPGEVVEYEAEATPRGIKITRLVVLSRPPEHSTEERQDP